MEAMKLVVVIEQRYYRQVYHYVVIGTLSLLGICQQLHHQNGIPLPNVWLSATCESDTIRVMH